MLKKILNKFIFDQLKDKLGENGPKPSKTSIYFNLDFNKLCDALGKINQNSSSFEFTDERFIIQNLINLIHEGKLQPNGIHFKHICSILRSLNNDEESIKYIGNDQVQYFYLSNEDGSAVSKPKKLYVSKIEYDYINRLLGENYDRGILKTFFLLDQQSNITMSSNQNLDTTTLGLINCSSNNNLPSPIGQPLGMSYMQEHQGNRRPTFIFPPTVPNSVTPIAFDFSNPNDIITYQPEMEKKLFDLLLRDKYKGVWNTINYT